MIPGLAHPPPMNVVVKTMAVVATSYCPDLYDSGRTFTGTIPAPGTAAVDPRVIPLRSYFIVNGSIFQALDTGGDVKGARVDLWSDSCAESWKWGRRSVNIALLGRVPMILLGRGDMVERKRTIGNATFHEPAPRKPSWIAASIGLVSIFIVAAFFIQTRRAR